MSTITEPRERGVPQPLSGPAPRSKLLEWVSTVDHKQIGILYLATTAVFFIAGGIEALLIRIQLAVPNNHFIGPETYNQLFTMHGTTMIFLVVMPMLLGFANYFVPLMIGAHDMAFPRLNALSYWLLLFGGILLYYSFVNGSAPDTGWFSYAPLTERPYSMLKGPDYWVLGLLVTSVGTIATAINLLVTVAKMRAPGMSASKIPVFVWMVTVNSFLIMWAIPSLTAAQVMLLLDRQAGTKFFDAAAGGDPLLWQHLFWFFGHPEVYIMVLPAFGMISEIVPVFSRKPIFGYGVVVGSGVAIGFYSFLVWAHHMFTVGLTSVALGFFGAASMVIAVPTGIKIFSWLATMWGGRIRFTTSMLFAIGFVAMFTIGGLSGVQFAIFPIDWQVTDTYYVVAHFHYVLFGGTFLGILGATYYWLPKITGKLLDERLGKWHFWLTFIGFNLTFFPMHILGLMGMARRTWTYPDLPGWGPINFIETVGAFILGVSVLVFAWNFYVSLRYGEPAGNDPWDAWTLEWATTSPPPPANFPPGTVPPITSARPLYDLKHREGASVTGPHRGLDSGPQPVAGGSGAGVLTEAPPASPPARTEGRRGVLDHWSTPMMGVVALITSEAFFFAALIITYLYYHNRSTSGPTAKDLDILRTGLFSIALWVSSGVLILAERRLKKGDHRGFRALLLLTIVLGAVFLYGQISDYAMMYHDHITIGSNLFTSAFYTLTGFHGAHVLVGLIMLAILAGLEFAGEFRGGRRGAAIESIATYWHFVDAIWVVLFIVIYVLGALGS